MSVSQRKILFVEPQETPKKIFAALLKPEENGWVLDFVSTAEEAMDRCTSGRYDILVTGNRLPGQSGIELLAKLKEVSPATIRFLLIDESEKANLRNVICSAQQILSKPLELSAFIKQVNRAFTLREVVANPAILQLLGGTESLPPLPRVFQELTQKLNDMNSSMHDLADIISKDIVLSSKVLKIANSALFSLRTPATSVVHAVSLLGSGAISSLVFSQGLSETFKGGGNTETFSEELNRHSIECATLVAAILSCWEASRGMVEKAILCGIAHDLGKLVLAKYVPDQWDQIQVEVNKGERPDVEIERELLGTSHCELAAYLLAIWGFPNDQIVAIAFHHEPSRTKEAEFGLLCALHIAENCCKTSLHRESFDWSYLEECRLSKGDIEGFMKMNEEAE